MKKFMIFALTAVFAAALQAEALYWQVDTGADDAAYTGTDVAYAGLYAIKTADLGSKPSSSATGATEIDFAEVIGGKAGPMLASIGEKDTTMSFFVELLNNSGEVVFTSGANTYDQLLASGYISAGGISTPDFTATSGFNGASVPEPTGGMLLLVGGALLALRRRRA